MNISLRHRCRNPRCKLKLPAPVENEHHAFCTRGCYESYYRARCRVCERDLRKAKPNSTRLYCRPPSRCAAEARKWPRKYALPSADNPLPADCTASVKNPHEMATNFGLESDRPAARSLRDWRWVDSGVGDLSLYDREGVMLARLVLEGGRCHLYHPLTWPRMAWSDLAEAKHHAEALTLCNLPLDSRCAARVRRENETPHPMGPVVNRQISRETAITSDWRSTGDGADVPDLPAFLNRRRRP